MSDWEVISIYTRAQAIEDGVLVDVSELARVAGFKYPVAVTQGVWSECVRVAEEDKCTQDENGRLWDILNVLLFTIKGKKDNGDEVKFKVRVWKNKGQEDVELWSKCGPGDDAEPVITIMLKDED